MRNIKSNIKIVSYVLWEIQKSLVMRSAYHCFIQKLMHDDSIPNLYFNIGVLHGTKNQVTTAFTYNDLMRIDPLPGIFKYREAILKLSFLCLIFSISSLLGGKITNNIDQIVGFSFNDCFTYGTISAQEKCSVFLYPLVTRSFYYFPCSHVFHADCLITEVSALTSI